MIDLAEKIYLQALTARLVGEDLLASYNKVAVVSMKNMICSAMAAASEACFIAQTGGKAWHFIIDEGNEKEIAGKLEEYDSDATLLLFGGETPIEKAKEMFVKLLEEMALLDIKADIIIHAHIFAAGGVNEAIKNERIVEYLKKRNVYVYTFELDNGIMLVHEIEFNGDITLHQLAELPITCEHANLLNRSLRGKKMAWVKE